MFKKKERIAPETIEDERHMCHNGHIWVETRRHSEPPSTNSFPFTRTDGHTVTMRVLEMYEEQRNGWTAIELRCTRCGTVDAKKIPYTG